jgi:transcriptional regulator with XRE-family HTH domain
MVRIKVHESAKAKGLSMREVATQLGVDHQTVLYWNQGRALPRLPMFLRLSVLLDCKLDTLLEAVKEKNNS